MRQRLTITLKDSILNKIDDTIDGIRIRNRSHAIEYLLNKAFYSSQTQAVILAGGKGTRMRPYTYELPKAMLPIQNKPILAHMVLSLRDAGIREVIFCVGERSEAIHEYFGNGERFGVHITYVQEQEELGTGGALLNARKLIHSSPFLLLYGDVFVDIDYKDLLSFHIQQAEMITMVLKPLQEVKAFGQITMRGSNVTGFYPHANKECKSNLVNAGIYVCNQDIFDAFSAIRTVFQIEGIVSEYIEKQQVVGYVHDGLWFDVGTPEDYEQAIKSAR
ncbi:hypothetical protein COU88_05055 [Candidatus Roizmanbacteria bacterium CG10_big_fil_rev_8_21_14_0_10_39_6]|uniref:Nucleotidyl transferase domain-containing protein n=1 Tax=Candidatus Roizmanbacteria bacterium CG10_big_fil_rev_8_21_14_0_10_39_6 TaxID=1974853 RepID=A0A2M8KR84_9BACT|nr:MAG: hypothetical protein COU88_05055 [Candidatus Roizmanbacteria bacterium CG10_big_fil_rev_8_21_14_0_10_39_6]